MQGLEFDVEGDPLGRIHDGGGHNALLEGGTKAHGAE
jgi:hypothetical protein